MDNNLLRKRKEKGRVIITKDETDTQRITRLESDLSELKKSVDDLLKKSNKTL